MAHMYYGPKIEAGDDLIGMMTIALEYAVGESQKNEELAREDVKSLKNGERISLPNHKR